MPQDQLSRPFEVTKSRVLTAGGPRFDQLEEDARRDAEDRRRLRWFIIAAAFIHTLLLVVALPQGREPERVTTRDDKIFVLETVRFKSPPPAVAQKALPKKKTKRIPMPDPTPDDPEPILEELDIAVPDIAPVGDFDIAVVIPDAPATRSGPSGTGSAQVSQVGDDVSAPVKIHAPQPLYTETARAARIQGVVILQAIIDAAGKVADVKILKGLPEGLDKSAIETIKTWTFKPARRAGLPVAVYFNLTVRFSLQ